MPVTATKLYAVQMNILRLLAEQSCPVLPNNQPMKAACRELSRLGLLDASGVVVSDLEGGNTFDMTYAANAAAREYLRENG